jgi:hypothetical protein
VVVARPPRGGVTLPWIVAIAAVVGRDASDGATKVRPGRRGAAAACSRTL